MKGFADASYVHAKVYGLRSQLLSRNDYAGLLAGSALDRFFSGLPAQPAPAQCTQVKEDIFRRSIRGILSLAEALGTYEKLFKAFLRLFEARNVKLMLARALGAGPVDGQWYDIRPYASFSRADIDAVSSWEDCAALISRSYLGQLVVDTGRPGFEEIESRVDLHCLSALFAAAEELPASDRYVVREAVLMGCAMLKILWSRRLERQYGWGRTAIDDHLAPIAALSKKCAHDNCGTKLRFFQRRLHGMLKKAGDQLGAPDSLFEQQAEQELYGYMRSLCATDFHSISCVVGYLWLLYWQIRNLFTVIEGIRFSLPAETITEALIFEA